MFLREVVVALQQWLGMLGRSGTWIALLALLGAMLFQLGVSQAVAGQPFGTIGLLFAATLPSLIGWLPSLALVVWLTRSEIARTEETVSLAAVAATGVAGWAALALAGSMLGYFVSPGILVQMPWIFTAFGLFEGTAGFVLFSWLAAMSLGRSMLLGDSDQPTLRPAVWLAAFVLVLMGFLLLTEMESGNLIVLATRNLPPMLSTLLIALMWALRRWLAITFAVAAIRSRNKPYPSDSFA